MLGVSSARRMWVSSIGRGMAAGRGWARGGAAGGMGTGISGVMEI